MICPKCGSELIYDAGISKNTIELKLICTCGFSQETSPDVQTKQMLELVGEYLRR